MGRYLIRRFLASLFTLWGLASLVFVLLRFFPGSPFDDDTALRPEIRQAMEELYHVSGGIGANYLSFLKALIRGDLGISIYFPNRSVQSILAQTLATSFLLNTLAFLSAILAGFSFGLLPWICPRTAPLIRAIERLALALPTLLLAPLALWLLAFQLDLFSLRVNEDWKSYFLPWLLLSFRPACSVARIFDARIAEEMSQPYILVHRSQGHTQLNLVFRGVLRICLPTFFQQIPQLAATILTGSLLIEILFSIQGMGFFFSESLLNRDWSLLMGFTLFFGALLIFTQMVVDGICLFLDPRVRFQ